MDKPVLDIQELDGITVIHVREEKLYQSVVEPFREKMLLLVDEGKRLLVVNLSSVVLMNSAGVGVLILVWDRLRQDGGQMVISGLSPLMRELFQRMRLDTYFPITESEEDAVAFLRRGKKNPAN